MYDAITANEINAEEFDRLNFYSEGKTFIYEFIGSVFPAFSYGGVPNFYEQTYASSPIIWNDNASITINYMVYGIHDIGIGELETEFDLYTFNIYVNEYVAIPIRFISKKK